MRLLPSLLVLALAAVAPGQVPDAPVRAAIRLCYELPMDTLQRSLRDQPDRDLEQLIEATVSGVRDRFGGATSVLRRGTEFTVELADADAAAISRTRLTVETAGKLEMRLVATADYQNQGVAFDLPQERQRLQAWLDAGGRERLHRDPRALDGFHDDRHNGPLAGKHLRWFKHRIRPNTVTEGVWQMRMQDIGPLALACVPAYKEADWYDGKVPAHLQSVPHEQRFLVELIAINMHAVHFANRDLDPAGIKTVAQGKGGSWLAYRIVDARRAEYTTWTGRHIGQFSAVLWDDEVLSTPKFVSRLPGVGAIQGTFTDEQLEAMCLALRSPLPSARPRFLRQEPVLK